MVHWRRGDKTKSAINTLNEQKSKMDAKCKDLFYMKCLLAYEDSNTIKPYE